MNFFPDVVLSVGVERTKARVGEYGVTIKCYRIARDKYVLAMESCSDLLISAQSFISLPLELAPPFLRQIRRRFPSVLLMSFFYQLLSLEINNFPHIVLVLNSRSL